MTDSKDLSLPKDVLYARNPSDPQGRHAFIRVHPNGVQEIIYPQKVPAHWEAMKNDFPTSRLAVMRVLHAQGLLSPNPGMYCWSGAMWSFPYGHLLSGEKDWASFPELFPSSAQEAYDLTADTMAFGIFQEGIILSGRIKLKNGDRIEVSEEHALAGGERYVVWSYRNSFDYASTFLTEQDWAIELMKSWANPLHATFDPKKAKRVLAYLLRTSGKQ